MQVYHKMNKIHVWTETRRNYGTPESPEWGHSGLENFFIINFKGGETDATATVMSKRGKIESDTPMFIRKILGWRIVPDDYRTQFERDQVFYEGKVFQPIEVIDNC
jgi:hypothetical protein